MFFMAELAVLRGHQAVMTNCFAGTNALSCRLRKIDRREFLSSKQWGQFLYCMLPASRRSYGCTFVAEASAASGAQPTLGFKKPAVIGWKEGMPMNRATLIGIIVREVKIKYLDSGKIVASCSIKVSRSFREDSWFYLEFWGDLAEIAAAHLKVDDQIFVSGSVWSETVKDEDSTEKTFAKVLVEDLKFVKQTGSTKFGTRSTRIQELNGEALWEDLFENSGEWVDCRKGKLNERSPDFKHVHSNKSVWINSKYTPKWVKERLEKESEGLKFIPNRTTEERWKDLFANPSAWWDNRCNKASSRSPDFRCKDTQEALWINSYSSPDWVKEKLALLDSESSLQQE
ncbi:hypothetical protein KP509_26G043600 [Ceratopteris richardii]|uniref:Uncharacterized protein n=1 Tax=Ceratopteris richardii TaxID=49495 RepID=A0A8T2RKE3_CERRI|nr:hypothetical protein KP509_26G043600 [Ceratopteris richardii]